MKVCIIYIGCHRSLRLRDKGAIPEDEQVRHPAGTPLDVPDTNPAAAPSITNRVLPRHTLLPLAVSCMNHEHAMTDPVA